MRSHYSIFVHTYNLKKNVRRYKCGGAWTHNLCLDTPAGHCSRYKAEMYTMFHLRLRLSWSTIRRTRTRSRWWWWLTAWSVSGHSQILLLRIELNSASCLRKETDWIRHRVEMGERKRERESGRETGSGVIHKRAHYHPTHANIFIVASPMLAKRPVWPRETENNRNSFSWLKRKNQGRCCVQCLVVLTYRVVLRCVSVPVLFIFVCISQMTGGLLPTPPPDLNWGGWAHINSAQSAIQSSLVAVSRDTPPCIGNNCSACRYDDTMSSCQHDQHKTVSITRARDGTSTVTELNIRNMTFETGVI